MNSYHVEMAEEQRATVVEKTFKKKAARLKVNGRNPFFLRNGKGFSPMVSHFKRARCSHKNVRASQGTGLSDTTRCNFWSILNFMSVRFSSDVSLT